MPCHNTLRAAAFATALPLLTLICHPALAADSPCKGLDQAACQSNPECRWKEAFTRKDGTQVSAHCRLAKLRKKQAAETQPAMPAQTPPTSAPAVAKPEAAATKPASVGGMIETPKVPTSIPAGTSAPGMPTQTPPPSSTPPMPAQQAPAATPAR